MWGAMADKLDYFRDDGVSRREADRRAFDAFLRGVVVILMVLAIVLTAAVCIGVYFLPM